MRLGSGPVGFGLAVLALSTLLPLMAPGYFVYVLTLGAVWAVAAVGLNLLTGFTGQISIGHAGFMAIGAYTSALLTLKLKWPFWAALPAAGLAAGMTGWALGVPALRLRGPYLAIATLGFGTAVSQVLLQWEPVTGGYMGLKPARPTWGWWLLSSDVQLYYLALTVLGLGTALAVNVLRSPMGRAFVALRDSEAAAQASGINVSRYKTMAFAISAFYAGVAGSLYAHVVGFISPFDFNLFASVFLLSIIVIGGLASVPGSVAGALALTVGLQLLSEVRDVRQVAYGLGLVLVVIFLPGGLWRAVERLAWSRRAPRIVRQAEGAREDVGPVVP